jgi:DNA-directed RNA polymerase subunit RPC12/RpoP
MEVSGLSGNQNTCQIETMDGWIDEVVKACACKKCGANFFESYHLEAFTYCPGCGAKIMKED